MLLLLFIYNPPQASRYADPDIFNYIENHVVHLSNNPKTKFCLVGDFNAGTGNLGEVIIDDTLSVRSYNDQHNVQNEINQRVNKDSVVKNYGRMLTQN